ncbi:hypothetical protein AB0C76_36660 [Kitasatospora sp. NPDC048722]|uniref:hypothetical protein n=1 Tax=Kitasatospora sp. NPDC048722 TaxID=3155639 RepID=UPI0033DD3A9E
MSLAGENGAEWQTLPIAFTVAAEAGAAETWADGPSGQAVTRQAIETVQELLQQLPGKPAAMMWIGLYRPVEAGNG